MRGLSCDIGRRAALDSHERFTSSSNFAMRGFHARPVQLSGYSTLEVVPLPFLLNLRLEAPGFFKT